MNKTRAGKALLLWHAVLLAAGMGLIVRWHLVRPEKTLRTKPTIEELKKAFPGDSVPSREESPAPHYKGDSVAGVLTAELPPRIKGYVDQVNMLVVVDADGTIREVKLIDHNETPMYMRRVLDSGLLESLAGRKVKDGFHDIDAVTGASVTARAMIDDVAAASALGADRIYGLDVKVPEAASWVAGLTDRRTLAVLAALAIALYGRFGPWPGKYKREAVWVSSILLIGIYGMTPYTLVHTTQLLKLSLPGPGNALLAALFVFVIGTTLLLGPVWCAHACPFGALQELLWKILDRRWEVTPAVMRCAREVRYLVLFICTAGVFGLGVRAFSEVEPFTHLFGRSREPAAWAFIAAVLFFSLFVKRFWCRFFCPTGACLVILSSHRKYLRSVRRGLLEAGTDSADKEEREQ